MKKGFTLIELLIVIAIILILIAIALPNFLEAQIRAKIAKVRSDLRTVHIAMESYFIDFRIYPPDHDPSERGGGLFQLTTPLKYLEEIPQDVFNQTGSGFNRNEPFFEMASTGISPGPLAFLGVAPRGNIHAYVVFSHGPDTEDDFSDNDGWPFGSANPCPNGVGYTRYSPTNGSKSRGDIDQPGGEWKAGCWCLDRAIAIKGRVP